MAHIHARASDGNSWAMSSRMPTGVRSCNCEEPYAAPSNSMTMSAIFLPLIKPRWLPTTTLESISDGSSFATVATVLPEVCMSMIARNAPTFLRTRAMSSVNSPFGIQTVWGAEGLRGRGAPSVSPPRLSPRYVVAVGPAEAQKEYGNPSGPGAEAGTAPATSETHLRGHRYSENPAPAGTMSNRTPRCRADSIPPATRPQ